MILSTIRHRSSSSHRPGRAPYTGVALAVASAVAIAIATLSHGDPAVLEDTSLFCLVCGRHGLTDVILNVVLFLPLGVGLRLAGWPVGRSILSGMLLSFAVESAQYLLLAGRAASLSDLIFNTVGTALGASVAHSRSTLLRPEPGPAARLAVLATLASLSVVAISGWALVPHFPPPPYAVNQIVTERGAMRPFEAPILRSTLGGTNYPPPRRIAGALALTESRPLDPARIEADAELLPMYPPGMLRPLVLLTAADSSVLLVLGQRHRSLVLRVGVRASSIRLVTPMFGLDDGFPAEATPRSDQARRDASPVRVSATHTPQVVTLRSERAGSVVEREIRRTPLLGWTMLMPFGIPHGAGGEVITALWTVALFIPGAFWAGRARPRHSWAPLAHLVIVLGGTVLVAHAFSLAAPGGLAMAALLAATWGGAAFGAWSCGRLAPHPLSRQVTAS